MAEKKEKSGPKYDVFYAPFFGAVPQRCGAGLSRKQAEDYVKEMQPAQPGQYEVKPAS